MNCRYLLILAITFTTTIQAQTIVPKRLDSLLGTIAKPNEPGFSIAIWQKGQLKYSRGYGLADLATGRKNTPVTPFNIASMGKQFTVASIYLLEQQGKLSTTDKLSKYFPDFPPYADSITIAQLIHHQSGIRDYIALVWLRNMEENSAYNDSLVYRLLSGQRSLNFAPGTQMSYSNSGYFLMGLIVKKLTGKDLATFEKEQLFGPLKMKYTQASRTHQVRNKANGYVEGEMYNPTNSVIGQGNVYSTVLDFAPWFKELTTHRLLGKAVWTKMLSPGEGTNYGGGLRISEYKGQKVIDHGGDISGYHSGMYQLPDAGIDIVIMGNNDRIYGPAVFRAVYGQLFPQPKSATAAVQQATLTNIDTSRYTGIYAAVADSMLNIEFSIADDKIMVRQHWDNGAYPVTAVNDSLFTIPGEPDVQFIFGGSINGKAGEMTIVQNGQRIGFKRTDKVAALHEEVVKSYNGSYYNPEIDAHYEVDNLVVRIGKAEYKLSRAGLKEDVFALDNGLAISFYRNAQGKVIGFDLEHTRVSQLRFTKE